MDYKKIGLFIQQKRKEKDLTQKELAKKLFLADKAISKWERGMGCPDVSILEDLSNVLEVSILSILNGEELEEDDINNAVLKTINYSKETFKDNFIKNISNLILIIVLSIAAFLLHANIGHIIYLKNIKYVAIDYSQVEDSIKLVPKIKEQIELIKTSELNFEEKDLNSIIRTLNTMYNQIIDDELYKITQDTKYTLKEIYYRYNKKQLLNSISVIRTLDNYDEENIIDVESYIDLTLLRMLSRQNIFTKMNSMDRYQNPVSFNEYNLSIIDSMAITFDFKMEVKTLNNIVNYVLKVGSRDE